MQLQQLLLQELLDDSGYDWMLLTMAQRFYLSDRKVLEEDHNLMAHHTKGISQIS